MGQALYRKYRPKSLEEISGQEHITRALTQALKAGHISHAYLFTGPRGTGKTSIARILAHAVNKLPYEDASAHLDIIEIDAASNRRIDEIRDLRDRVHIAPTSATYKVYIIDEVHMLTREAFNALLKTLEEPPAHVIFILATTEAYKLPETIISRTQRFAFRPASPEKVTSLLREIAKAEKISVDDAALELIAQHGDGSFRDSVSLLDQARTVAPRVTLDDVRGMLGLAPDEALAELISHVEAGQSTEVVQSLQQLREQGLEAAQLAKQLGQAWRKRLLDNLSSLTPAALLRLLERLLTIANSSNPFSLLEITLLETSTLASPAPAATVSATPANRPATTSKPVATAKAKAPKAPPAPKPTTSFDKTIWPELLNAIKQSHNTLYGIVRMATPEFANDQLHLTFRFAFHQKRVNEVSNKKVIGNILYDITGKNIEVVCELDTGPRTEAVSEPEAPTGKATTAKVDPSLTTISNIFGSAELLESEN